MITAATTLLELVAMNGEQVSYLLTHAKLTERELHVLEVRFGLNGTPSHSLENVAAMLKVTRERVRQIEARALRKLRAVDYPVDDVRVVYPEWAGNANLLHAVDAYREQKS
jgi:DNA-binding CsgD family transcriptional regulator